MSVVRRVLVVLTGASLLLLPAVVCAQTGTIAGTVIEDVTTMPLSGVGTLAVIVRAYDRSGNDVGSDETDTSGAYTIPNLAPGSYYVKVVRAQAHVAELHDNLACIAADCPVTSGTPVVVTADTTTSINFSLARSGAIMGTVRRANGETVDGATVYIYNASTSLVTSVTTAFDGTYSVWELAAGTYLARAVPSEFHDWTVNQVGELYGGVQCSQFAPETDCRIASSAPITVTAGMYTPSVDFSFDAGGTISGTVTSNTGAPMANVFVSAYAGDVMMSSHNVRTDSAGQYVMTAIPPGRYRLRTDVARPPLQSGFHTYVDEWHDGVCVGCAGGTSTIEVTAGQTVTSVNFSLAPGGSIAGILTCEIPYDPAARVRQPEIVAYSAAGEPVRRYESLVDTCPAGPSGPLPVPSLYAIFGLPTGTYYLWARSTPTGPDSATGLRAGRFIDQLYGGLPCNTVDCDVRKGVPVTVTAGGSPSIAHFTLQRGGGLTLPPGTQGVRVFDSRGIETVNAVGSTASVGGAPLVDGLPPGTYYVVTTQHQLNGGIACADCPPTAGAPVVIAANGTSSPILFGVPPLQRVSGAITNAAGGAPLSTITVELITQGGRVVASALSDLRGRYTLEGLPPGTYFARTVNDRGFIDEVYQDAGCGTCDPRGGTPIVVSSSTDISSIDFTLAPGGIISGVVSDSDGGVLSNVPVSMFAGTNTLAAVKSSNRTGRYRATVPAGTYRALAEATARNGSEVYSELPCTSAACDPSAGTAITVTTGTIASGINFTLTSCNAMSVSPSILASGLVGTAYRQVFSAIGGTGPYAFDVTDGALPLGVTLHASTGVLSGLPTTAGRSTFRISALDANGCATDRSYVLDVQACAFTLSPATATVAAAGGNVAITIANACGSHEVIDSSDWISVQSNTVDQVTLTVAANTQSAARIASVSIGRRAFELRQAGIGSLAPYGFLDLPAQNAQVSGAVAIGGWALDDVEVTRVRVYRDAVAGEPGSLVFVGNAVFIPGARPDVQRGAPGVPNNDRAGFGFLMLTNTLPNQGNGTFRIHAIADDAEGHSTVLGTRTIISNNTTSQRPFGAIDTPLQGQTIGGANFVNFAWALTPQPGLIPMDGSTIQVIIDGLPVGAVDYNHFRPDVSNTFPGLANSAGPVGFRIIDTTALAEGLHTISWTVTDSRPATEGLGSRYFTVSNSADAPVPGNNVTATEMTAQVVDVAKPLGAAPAPDAGRRTESLALATNHTPTRARSLTLAPMERLELSLASLVEPTDDACFGTWAGYLVKDQVLGDLPVGASLDPAGTFYWQTGPGFAGRFSLLFVRTNCRGEKQQIPITVTIPLR